MTEEVVVVAVAAVVDPAAEIVMVVPRIPVSFVLYEHSFTEYSLGIFLTRACRYSQESILVLFHKCTHDGLVFVCVIKRK